MGVYIMDEYFKFDSNNINKIILFEIQERDFGMEEYARIRRSKNP